ncbi:MAG: hypothetical protein COY66_05945 [Candidatus Kerfeldbacteria bacterium CG_4_10_14_0_8_um_filter_42_10]|uniref:HTH arsR-type domain-containing protein n=1 Tax=Candidatus Kerfeldbacteria bacterium CG_4_10_14_0_8_um_filter_42_10 TaxID=2014248 RepID=A0A2M7RGF4_9BACT|nr:MAG: hypothetical protein COY66_05945 [Candidatus Kerfeldbacteria bacterium CG_4_10_14_0_8_um_filter_42_10]
MSLKYFQLHSRLLKALANPKRLEIIQLLRNDCLAVREIERMTGLNQADISQNLQILRQENLVITKRNGKEISYCLAHPNIIKAFDSIHAILVDRKKIKPEHNKRNRVSIPTIIDPVCGMKVSPQQAVFLHRHKRTTYYFCASGCQKVFKKNPEKYVPNN